MLDDLLPNYSPEPILEPRASHTIVHHIACCRDLEFLALEGTSCSVVYQSDASQALSSGAQPVMYPAEPSPRCRRHDAAAQAPSACAIGCGCARQACILRSRGSRLELGILSSPRFSSRLPVLRSLHPDCSRRLPIVFDRGAVDPSYPPCSYNSSDGGQTVIASGSRHEKRHRAYFSLPLSPSGTLHLLKVPDPARQAR